LDQWDLTETWLVVGAVLAPARVPLLGWTIEQRVVTTTDPDAPELSTVAERRVSEEDTDDTG
jgi:hypothetical protein